MDKSFNKDFNKEKVEEYIKGIRAGDRLCLSRAITLVESNRPTDQQEALHILNACIPYSGNSFRLGVSGVPGVGKSSFIDVLGNLLIERGNRVAVLTVDPSSVKGGGSILGDKTRMERLSRSQKAFVRPSPSAGSLGGVARKTREVSLLCEAAGYNWILIETVGVGQSEVEVRNMVDFFLLLLLPNAGDDIQGMKKGIVEIADGLVINKAEKDQLPLARKAQQFYKQTIGLHSSHQGDWSIPVLLCSAWEEVGFEEILEQFLLFEHTQKKEGKWEANRTLQQSFWFDRHLEEGIKSLFFNNPFIQQLLASYQEKIQQNKISPIQAAQELLEFWEKK